MLTEADLAAKVVSWLQEQHWTVYQEVQPAKWGGPRADIVAVQGQLVWVIECKKSLGLSVLAQADRWRAHFRSVAVPKSKQHRDSDRGFAIDICKMLGIGILEVGIRSGVTETRDAPLKREYHRYAKELAAKLVPQQQTAALAGSKGGGYWTPYRGTMNAVQVFLRGKAEGASLKEILTAVGKGHYASSASARSGLRHCLENYESDWCFVDKTVKPWKYRLR